MFDMSLYACQRRQSIVFVRSAFLFSWISAHLSGVDELQWSQSSLEVGGVGLEVIEGAGDARLQFGGLGMAGGVEGDLVDCA